MAITKRNPGVIYLGGGDGPGGEGGMTVVNEYTAGAAIKPGMVVETYNDAGTTKVRPHSGAAEMLQVAVALEQLEMNLGVEDNYAIGDLVKYGIMKQGSMFWGIVVTGQDISNQELMQSNGDGKLKTALATTATANVGRLRAHDNLGLIAADTRCRTEVLY